MAMKGELVELSKTGGYKGETTCAQSPQAGVTPVTTIPILSGKFHGSNAVSLGNNDEQALSSTRVRTDFPVAHA